MANINTDLMAQLGLMQQQQKKSEQSDSSNHLGQQDFLKLMLTQLQNQNPLKPMDSGQFLGQLAQFGTVNGITQMEKSLDELTNAVRGSQTLQAALLVDQHVWVKSHEAWLPKSGSLQARVQVPDGATDVEVSIYDLHGERVAHMDVDPDDRTSIQWNGLLDNGEHAEPGFYKLEATGQLNGEATEFPTLVSGQVESVSRKAAGEGLQLTVTGAGVVNLSDIHGIG